MAVPFEISDINNGFRKATGLFKLWKEGVELEFEVKGVVLGFSKGGVKNVRISYQDLESIQFKKGWFSGKIILGGVSMKVFDKVPGTDVATCTLNVKRGDRREAQSLVSQARLHHSEAKLNQMDKSD